MAEKSADHSSDTASHTADYEKALQPETQHATPHDTAMTNEKSNETDIHDDTLAKGDVEAEAAKERDPDDEQDSANYPSGGKKLIITLALSFSVLCVALDNTVSLARMDIDGANADMVPDHRNRHPSNHRRLQIDQRE